MRGAFTPGERWSFQAIHDAREAETVALASGASNFLDSSRSSAEASFWTPVSDEKGHLVGGLSYREERIDSADPSGVQTLLTEPAKTDFVGVFAELDYPLSERLTAYASMRWDDGTLYDPQLSVRASVVCEIGEKSSLRVAYANAFIAPTPGERICVVAGLGDRSAAFSITRAEPGF